MGRLFDKAMRFIDGMGTQEWIVALALVVVVAVLCLRGFGSRSNY